MFVTSSLLASHHTEGLNWGPKLGPQTEVVQPSVRDPAHKDELIFNSHSFQI